MEHTKLPWTTSHPAGNIRKVPMPHGEAPTYRAGLRVDGKPPFKFICKLDFGYGRSNDNANAEFIVRACNEHYKNQEIINGLNATVVSLGKTRDKLIGLLKNARITLGSVNIPDNQTKNIISEIDEFLAEAKGGK